MLRCDLIFPATSIKSDSIESRSRREGEKEREERGRKSGRTQRDHEVFRFLRFFVDADIWRAGEPAAFSSLSLVNTSPSQRVFIILRGCFRNCISICRPRSEGRVPRRAEIYPAIRKLVKISFDREYPEVSLFILLRRYTNRRDTLSLSINFSTHIQFLVAFARLRMQESLSLSRLVITRRSCVIVARS